MLVHSLTDQLSVAAQIEVTDVATLAARGFHSIINNRPDGEADDQPSSAAMEAAARHAGLDYRYIPVISGQVSDSQAQDFAAALAELPGPVLAFCRSGMRSTMLWALQADAPADAIVQTAHNAGYDLAALHARLSATRHNS